MNRVLITGGTGFVGSRLAARLVEQKIETHLYVRSSSNTWRINHFKKNLFLHEIDLLDSEKVKSSIEKIKPDYIFHLACYGGLYDEKDSALILKTNILITQILLQACENSHLKKFIYIGSSSEYGIKNNPMTEDMREEPNSLYGISKLAGTHLVQYYGREKIFSTVILRIFSAYGCYEDARRLVPMVISACLKKQALKLGSGKQPRDFIYVEDIIDALLLSMNKGGAGEIINLGSGKPQRVADVVNTVLSILDYPIKPEWGALPDRANEPLHWVADITKAFAILGWVPKTSLQVGLTSMINWVKQHEYK